MKSMVVLRTTTYRLSRSMVCLYLPFQAVSAVSFSHTMCLLSGLLCSCFLQSSVLLVHDVCTGFHASVQVNRRLVLWLVLRATITVDGSSGWVQGMRVWAYNYQGIKMSNIVYQNIRIAGHYNIKQVQDIMITESGYQGYLSGYQHRYLWVSLKYLTGYRDGAYDIMIRVWGYQASWYQGVQVKCPYCHETESFNWWACICTIYTIFTICTIKITPSVSILLSSFWFPLQAGQYCTALVRIAS